MEKMELKFLDKVRFRKDTGLPGLDHRKLYVLLGIECGRFDLIEYDKLGTCAIEHWQCEVELLEKIL
jgi:hypothetical protein